MFESDDYDQILSQIDFPEVVSNSLQKDDFKQNPTEEVPTETSSRETENLTIKFNSPNNSMSHAKNSFLKAENISSPKHTKRKIIHSHFDHKNKRKFPGPAGLLTGSFEKNYEESIGQIELLSQDMDFTQNYLHGDIFETPLWKRLIQDTMNLGEINSINTIKNQALAGNLQRKKAQIVIAFVESVDRSAIDPLIIIRDKTGNIKCTLHRDAWNTFSNYIVSEYCALVLWKPTVLTTGSAFKKHYLNITLSNISSIYTSAVINDEEVLPNGYKKICENEFSIISINKTDNLPSNETVPDNLDLEDLGNVFLDEEF